MNTRQSMQGVASAEARHQMTRRFARGLLHDMTPMQLAVMHALLFNAALYALEAWEKGRASRDAAAFYEGDSEPSQERPRG